VNGLNHLGNSYVIRQLLNIDWERPRLSNIVAGKCCYYFPFSFDSIYVQIVRVYASICTKIFSVLRIILKMLK
jgi:hypothetical protein